MKAATTASRLRDAKSGHGVSRRLLARSLARELIQKREEEEEEEEEKEERRAARATARGKRRTGPDRSQQQTDWSVAALGL